ncbi:hypothetical protein N7478_008149 [Penicillium angulare]|uniref:uncharacterized protein n=1 Tax=Penicillium angulare TaxID=116970 RepID=UPI002541B9B6|nr:uncharacterized protein N7478_008149 [Penicillium angulare]KAJ5273024.1 hypothetical protein N7478_008149 [Penicillium angulare]
MIGGKLNDEPSARSAEDPEWDHRLVDVSKPKWRVMDNKEGNRDKDEDYDERDDDMSPDHAALIDARMTPEQKYVITDYLGDWGLYSDWDTMVATFPLKGLRHGAFINAVISKDIFQNLVANPFYYMDLGDGWEGNHKELPTPLAEDLHKLWQNMKHAMPYK